MTRIVKQELADFLAERINHYADRIKVQPQRADRSALGELDFYLALHNVVYFPNNERQDRYDQASLRDEGMMDAINDTLIKLGLIARSQSNEKFFNLFWEEK